MAKVTRSVVVAAPIEKIFDIVTDFGRYPDFLEEIPRADVISKKATKAKVAFTANIVKRIDYTMAFDLKRPTDITWRMTEGDLLIKKNVGSWKLQKLEKNLTDLTFTCEIEFNIWMPSAIAEGVIASHLPKMMEGFKAQAEASRVPPARGKAKSPVARKKRPSARRGKK